ncbi:DUF948 domain-containing protein [Thermasporomyces composti]|jgi:hypothetical protein|uniref:Uncharacterized protein DUF948 n=1 Tax=Thermasporomyces composti TaxID=696763 RepID=A0A3D9V9U2_THECX|nr:DUF948 domain-containing protein [Thermasporomyces composti]REF38249.1 uncharacterized protein DUF948 [Thermasporomyces composti]
MTAGEIAGLIAASALLLLVGVLTYPIVKLGKTLEETRQWISGAKDRSLPLIDEVNTTVSMTNAQLARVDAITARAETVSENIAGLSSLFAATLGGPLVKVAAFSYGVRRAIAARDRKEIERRVRAEMKGGRRKRGAHTA